MHHYDVTFYHGSPTRLQIGAELSSGIVGGAEDDPLAHQPAVWATTTGAGMAWKWAERLVRHLPEQPNIWVYEVELSDPKPDVNGLFVLAVGGGSTRRVGRVC